MNFFTVSCHQSDNEQLLALPFFLPSTKPQH